MPLLREWASQSSRLGSNNGRETTDKQQRDNRETTEGSALMPALHAIRADTGGCGSQYGPTPSPLLSLCFLSFVSLLLMLSFRRGRHLLRRPMVSVSLGPASRPRGRRAREFGAGP